VAAVGALVVVAALGAATWWLAGSSEHAGPSTTTVAPTSAPPPTAAPVVAPLTGLPSADGDRPRALVVKIDAAPEVTRFTGVQRADLVDEVLVDGGITRYLAVFQSQETPTVGPVRSIRTSDFDLVADLGKPIVVYSGADRLTGRAIPSGVFIPFDPDSPGGDAAFHRDYSLRPPHNLFVSPAAVRSTVADPGTATAPFAHLAPGQEPVPGSPAAGVRIRFTPDAVVTFRWDAARREWLRSRGGRPEVDETGRQLGVTSVVVLDISYGHAPWDRAAPQAVTTGHGGGMLLAGGTARPILWSRPSPEDPFTLVGAGGAPVALPAGRTWVEFPAVGTATEILPPSLG
jgi:hypothetical protein